jgi:DNA-binding NarL/FixJ family response regulator
VTTVLVADDHRLVRQSIVKAIRAIVGFEVVGEAADGREAVQLTRSLEPDIVILDITMPHVDGLRAAQEIVALDRDVQVIFLSMHDDAQTIQRALSLGAAGYVSKDASLAEVSEAVQAVSGGSSYLSPLIAGKVMELASGRSDPSSQLTEREREILELLSTGERLSDIADQLYLSIKTVKNHLTSIYSKLGVSTGTQAVARAYRDGIVRRGPT